MGPGLDRRLTEAIKRRPLPYRLACVGHRLAVRSVLRIHSTANRLRYDAPVRPLELLSVDPRAIQVWLAEPFESDPWFRPAPVLAGSWDQQTRPLSEYDLFDSVYTHFTTGLAWEETDFYQRVVSNIESRDDWNKWGCETLADFERRLAHLDELYADIDESGYRTQRELRQCDDDPLGAVRSLPPALHEVTVHIGRGGTFIFHEGRHRLATAQALGLDSIPVRVMARHERWQAIRERVVDRGVDSDTEAVADHPDIAGLVGDA